MLHNRTAYYSSKMKLTEIHIQWGPKVWGQIEYVGFKIKINSGNKMFKD